MNNFIGNFIISFKEILEAGIVISIVFIFLIKQNNKSWKKMIFPIGGTTLGALSAIAIGAISYYGKVNFDDKLWFNISIYTLVLVSVSYFLYWMFKQNYNFKNEINNNLEKNKYGYLIASFFITFIAIFREGTEIVLITFEDTNYIGIGSGIAAALLFMFIIYLIPSKFINVGKIMTVLSIVLIFSTAPIAAKWFELIIWKGIDIYHIDATNGWSKFGLAIMRGILGFKSSLRLSGLISMLIWDISWILIYIYLRKTK